MAAEISTRLSDILRKLPPKHPDRLFLEGIHKVFQGYLKVASPSIDDSSVEAPPNQNSLLELRQEDKKWLTTQEVAKYLKVHPRTIRRYAKQGVLPEYRVTEKGRSRFLRQDLDLLMNKNRIMTNF